MKKIKLIICSFLFSLIMVFAGCNTAPAEVIDFSFEGVENYEVGEDFSTGNLRLKLQMSNGTAITIPITDAMIVEEPDMTEEGIKTVKVLYDGVEYEFTFFVGELVLDHYSFTGVDNFYVNENFTTDGVKLVFTYTDNSTFEVSVTMEMVEIPDMSTPGTKKVFVTYLGQEYEYSIIVMPLVVEDYEFTGVKDSYESDLPLNIDEIKLHITYTNGHQVTVDLQESMIKGLDMTVVGEQQVRVQYGDGNFFFDIEIYESQIGQEKREFTETLKEIFDKYNETATFPEIEITGYVDLIYNLLGQSETTEDSITFEFNEDSLEYDDLYNELYQSLVKSIITSSLNIEKKDVVDIEEFKTKLDMLKVLENFAAEASDFDYYSYVFDIVFPENNSYYINAITEELHKVFNFTAVGKLRVKDLVEDIFVAFRENETADLDIIDIVNDFVDYVMTYSQVENIDALNILFAMFDGDYEEAIYLLVDKYDEIYFENNLGLRALLEDVVWAVKDGEEISFEDFVTAVEELDPRFGDVKQTLESFNYEEILNYIAEKYNDSLDGTPIEFTIFTDVLAKYETTIKDFLAEGFEDDEEAQEEYFTAIEELAADLDALVGKGDTTVLLNIAHNYLKTQYMLAMYASISVIGPSVSGEITGGGDVSVTGEGEENGPELEQEFEQEKSVIFLQDLIKTLIDFTDPDLQDRVEWLENQAKENLIPLFVESLQSGDEEFDAQVTLALEDLVDGNFKKSFKRLVELFVPLQDNYKEDLKEIIDFAFGESTVEDISDAIANLLADLVLQDETLREDVKTHLLRILTGEDFDLAELVEFVTSITGGEEVDPELILAFEDLIAGNYNRFLKRLVEVFVPLNNEYKDNIKEIIDYAFGNSTTTELAEGIANLIADLVLQDETVGSDIKTHIVRILTGQDFDPIELIEFVAELTKDEQFIQIVEIISEKYDTYKENYEITGTFGVFSDILRDNKQSIIDSYTPLYGQIKAKQLYNALADLCEEIDAYMLTKGHIAVIDALNDYLTLYYEFAYEYYEDMYEGNNAMYEEMMFTELQIFILLTDTTSTVKEKIDEIVELYKEDIAYSIAYAVMCNYDAGVDSTECEELEAILTLHIDKYLEENFEFEKFARDIIRFIDENCNESFKVKAYSIAGLLAVLNKDAGLDYNKIFGDIELPPEIESIDYNKLVAALTDIETYKIFDFSDIEVTTEVDEDGNLTKQIIEFKVDVDFDVTLTGIEGDLGFTIILNY